MNLWNINQTKLVQYEKSFITIGTAAQERTSIRREELWDAEQKDYKTYQGPQYGSALPLSVLDFPGSNYIGEPEFRPCYLSCMSGYQLENTIDEAATTFVAEIEPIEDCIPDHSVQVVLSSILSEAGTGYREGMTIWFCNHTQPNPEPLYAGKKYVVILTGGGNVHGEGQNLNETTENIPVYEYVPLPIQSYQADGAGNRIKGKISAQNAQGYPMADYYELTEGFYESEAGSCYLECVKAAEKLNSSVPVTGTNDTVLLMAFYNKDAYIVEGQDISAKEYQSGEKVCLVPKTFAKNNGLQVGASIELNLYAVVYGQAASEGSGLWSIADALNADGKAYSVFEKGIWRIAGIYDTQAGVIGTEYGLAENEIIIPSKSVEKSGEDHIMRYGRMTGTTTSFRIPNGATEEFMENWNKAGSNELNIVFYDGGFSKIKNGMENLKKVSNIMIVTGSIMIVTILFLFAHIYILQQKRSFAIQRSLGMGKGQCIRALFLGVFLILVLGSVLGGITGSLIISEISLDVFQISYYDTLYTSNLMSINNGIDKANLDLGI